MLVVGQNRLSLGLDIGRFRLGRLVCMRIGLGMLRVIAKADSFKKQKILTRAGASSFNFV